MSLTQKKIKIICPSHKLASGEQIIIEHYRKCSARYGGFDLQLLKPLVNTKTSKLEQEAKSIQTQIPSGSHTIALSERGKKMSTHQLATHLIDHPSWCFVIGSSDGLSESLTQQAHTHLSLSPLTFTHQMALCLVAEQIFRILSIYNNHPYHRD